MLKILHYLKQYKLIQHGEFTLKNGEKSNIYVNLKNLVSFPDFHEYLAQQIIYKIHHENLEFDLICGVPYGAISLATLVSVMLKKPMIMLRKERKDHGTKKLVEGFYQKGKRVLLLEDVVTTGSSIHEAVQVLTDHDLNVVGTICIISRNSMPMPNIYPLTYLDPRKSLQSSLCVAVDVTNMNELYRIIDNVGKHVDVIKTHIDMISDFTDEDIDTLVELKNKYRFLLWEDRKFADIGNTVYHQIHSGIHKISEWADMISVHLVSGEDILKQTSLMVVAIADMSSKGSVMSEEYSKSVVKICERHDNVVGIVTQYNHDTELLKIVAGISSTSLKDDKGQRYSTIEQKAFADIFVVGRGITKSKDVEGKTLEYIKNIKYYKKMDTI